MVGFGTFLDNYFGRYLKRDWIPQIFNWISHYIQRGLDAPRPFANNTMSNIVLVKMRDESKQFSVVIVARYFRVAFPNNRQFEVTLWTVILKWIGLEFDCDRPMERHTHTPQLNEASQRGWREVVWKHLAQRDKGEKILGLRVTAGITICKTDLTSSTWHHYPTDQRVIKPLLWPHTPVNTHTPVTVPKNSSSISVSSRHM